MRDTFLPFAPPALGPEEIEEVTAALRSDWITTGPRVERFEDAFAEFVGAPRAVAVSSCTAGLHTALAVAGIGPGDAVITTPMTFASTANAISKATQSLSTTAMTGDPAASTGTPPPPPATT